MGQQISATGVVFETDMEHYIILKIHNTDKTYLDWKCEERIEITLPEQKIELLCKLVDHADMKLCCKTYLKGPLQEILQEIEKIDSSIYPIANMKFGKFNPYEPYQPYKLLASIHPNIDEFVNKSRYKNTYVNISLGIKILDIREKILEGYAKLSNQSFEQLKSKFVNNKNREDCFACCKMFNIQHSEEFRDCQCDYCEAQDLLNLLTIFGCFDNVEEFTKRFISPEIKIVGLKRKFPNKVNPNAYII